MLKIAAVTVILCLAISLPGKINGDPVSYYQQQRLSYAPAQVHVIRPLYQPVGMDNYATPSQNKKAASN